MENEFVKFSPEQIETLPIGTEIGKLSIQHGDVLFIKICDDIEISRVIHLKEAIKSIFPNNKCLCYQGGIEISVIGEREKPHSQTHSQIVND
jgi:hypothetical protein